MVQRQMLALRSRLCAVYWSQLNDCGAAGGVLVMSCQIVRIVVTSYNHKAFN